MWRLSSSSTLRTQKCAFQLSDTAIAMIWIFGIKLSLTFTFTVYTPITRSYLRYSHSAFTFQRVSRHCVTVRSAASPHIHLYRSASLAGNECITESNLALLSLYCSTINNNTTKTLCTRCDR